MSGMVGIYDSDLKMKQKISCLLWDLKFGFKYYQLMLQIGTVSYLQDG